MWWGPPLRLPSPSPVSSESAHTPSARLQTSALSPPLAELCLEDSLVHSTAGIGYEAHTFLDQLCEPLQVLRNGLHRYKPGSRATLSAHEQWSIAQSGLTSTCASRHRGMTAAEARSTQSSRYFRFQSPVGRPTRRSPWAQGTPDCARTARGLECRPSHRRHRI